MSLDIWLEGEPGPERCVCPECDNEHEALGAPELYSANITHNLGRMAREAGIYEVLWRPDQNGIDLAGQLVEPLAGGLNFMRAYPAKFEALNARNGWGTYENFLPWLESLLAACREHPGAKVRVYR